MKQLNEKKCIALFVCALFPKEAKQAKRRLLPRSKRYIWTDKWTTMEQLFASIESAINQYAKDQPLKWKQIKRELGCPVPKYGMRRKSNS